MITCDQISARWISGPCCKCDERPAAPEKLHVVLGKYYCKEHCPKHGAAPPLFATEDEELTNDQRTDVLEK